MYGNRFELVNTKVKESQIMSKETRRQVGGVVRGLAIAHDSAQPAVVQSPAQEPAAQTGAPAAVVATAVDSAPQVQHAPPVMQPTAFPQQCVLCGGTLTDHFSNGAWTGCTKTEHGARFFLPPMLLAVTPQGIGDAEILSRVRSHRAPRASKRTVAHLHPSETASTPARRGRTPGVYKASEDINPDKVEMTDSMRRVFNALRHTKRGQTARKIAARLTMPMGTVGWVLTRLQERGAVARTVRTA